MDKSGIKIAALVAAPYNKSPSQRFRIEQWESRLKRDGFSIDYFPFKDAVLDALLYEKGYFWGKAIGVIKAYLRRLMEIKQIKNYDLVYLQREAAIIGPAIIESVVAWGKKPIVYDFDDAIWIPDISPVNRWFSYLKCNQKTARICKLSAHVMVGNQYLKNYASQFNLRVTVIPTTIDFERFHPRPEGKPNQTVTIGWTGSFSTYPYLEMFMPVLKRVYKKIPFRLKTVGVPFARIQGIESVSIPWHAETESQDLDDMDIGIMPLPDTSYTRGKCGLKILQYMAKGIPAVASNVGVNGEIIRDGWDGYLAASSTEWEEKLIRLLMDPKLRKTMGANGRLKAEKGYSAETWAKRVGEVFNSVVS